MKDKKIMQK